MKSINLIGKNIKCDIDGTLTIDTAWSEEDCLTVRPKPEVIELLNKEFDKQGSDITIYTARKESFRENTKKWLVLHGVKYHHLEMEKLPWGEYWDSDAVRPEELLPIKYTVSD